MWTVLGATSVAAVIDWFAVARSRLRLEYIFKPTVMVGFVALAVLSHPERATIRGLVVVALSFGLLGDVALMLEHRRPAQGSGARRAGGTVFTLGLAAFLLGHLAYVGAMYLTQFDLLGAGMGAVLTLLILLASGLPILSGARRRGGMKLAVPVGTYMFVLGAMLVFGVATASPYVTYGAIVFVLSDLILGLDRFVRSHPAARLAIVVSYHCAQALLVLGLAVGLTPSMVGRL